MKDTHTPGPWEFDGVRVFAPALDEKVPVALADGTIAMHGMGLIALPYACGPLDGSFGSHDANSNLIAAAPEYKALVVRAVAVLQRHAPPDGLSDHEALNELYGIFDGPEYRAAIAKAEGGQP